MVEVATSTAAPSGTSEAAGAPSGTDGVRCMGCGTIVQTRLVCPTCQKAGIRDAIFCGTQCFKDNWKKHKELHKKAPANGSYKFPEGTHDPFAKHSEHYTGPLRAVYPDTPVPTRVVPEHIPRPEYVIEAKGMSWPETLAHRKGQTGKILDAQEIEGMRKVCRLAREVLDLAAAALRPGITTLELDEIVHKACVERDSYPSPLGYRKFPRSVCTSVNEVICHGIPDARPLEDGDIVNLDVTLYHGGFHGDVNATYPVGEKVSQRNLDLIKASRECLDEAIRICKPGVLLKEVGNVIEPLAAKYGFSTNKTYVGHGINSLFHPPPNIPHYAGSKVSGKMKAGMAFTIEPMICTGLQQDKHWRDKWTSVTEDGKPSAQFEETLLITETGVEVLTAAPGWQLPERSKAK